MAVFNHIVVALAILAVALLPATTIATDYVVGDGSGWTIDYDYQAWASNKAFKVGDNLVPPPNKAHTSGHDIISLSTPGKMWFLCGIEEHCSEYNQKLAVNVKAYQLMMIDGDDDDDKDNDDCAISIETCGGGNGVFVATDQFQEKEEKEILMANFSHIVAVLAISVLVLLPVTTLATEFVVGDSSGWTTNFDYQTWAKDKVFYVGDKLVFNYPKGSHNVYKVNATAFASCTVPDPSTGLTSGNDVVTLIAPGKKWYICGVGNHCSALNQKLVINVEGGAPAPAPSSATKSGYQILMGIVVVLALIILV
uniref:uncharacterized protein LOC122595410 n=1 Tax=Erigeron canadensis TaxID=72917 RepID=UPI001CB949F7|nr:uncharacterized protein LOC122595410 [Erigeron canadensis]